MNEMKFFCLKGLETRGCFLRFYLGAGKELGHRRRLQDGGRKFFVHTKDWNFFNEVVIP